MVIPYTMLIHTSSIFSTSTYPARHVCTRADHTFSERKKNVAQIE